MLKSFPICCWFFEISECCVRLSFAVGLVFGLSNSSSWKNFLGFPLVDRSGIRGWMAYSIVGLIDADLIVSSSASTLFANRS